MKILIIDDERAIRNSLKEILQDEGYDVEVAEDGRAGLEAAGKNRYDVIFCDIKMPGMEGTEVLVKLQEEGIDSAVVMISGHGDIDTAVDCIKKGAFDFIQKPLDLNRILITIKIGACRPGGCSGPLRKGVGERSTWGTACTSPTARTP